ncbi:MAG: hypothetical protein AB7O68_25730 [Pirellulales bacterium]
MINIPQEIKHWLRDVFRRAGVLASAKLTHNPFAYEEHLDISVVECLQQVAVPVQFSGGWTVHIDTHFLGKVPMFGNFEVADIGILVIFRTASRFVRSKVALLQSKRLYPLGLRVETESQRRRRYGIGFGRLFADDNDFGELVSSRKVKFAKTSTYKALRGRSQQTTVIDDYEKHTQIPVYYLLYNPFVIPHTVHVPAPPFSGEPNESDCHVGARVVPAADMHRLLRSSTRSPSYSQLVSKLPKLFSAPEDRGGWTLEKFVVDLLLQCKVGRVTDVRSDEGLFRVFYRRSGPMAAALSVTIDAPAEFDWSVVPDGD